MIDISMSLFTTINNGGELTAPTEPPDLTGLFDIVDGFGGDKYFINLNSINSGGKATSWAWVGAPPPWANLSNSGSIAGTATIGSWTGYAVTATNDLGSSTSNTDAAAITLQIPILSKVFDILDGLVGDTYNIDLNTLNTGGTAASWNWNGTPPPWANSDTSTGLITGTATDGTWTGYSVTATNATGSDTSNTDSITIVPSIPNLTGVFDLVDGYVGDGFNLDLSTLNTGGVAASWSWFGSPPTWANLDTATGIITGTATEGSWSGYAVVATNAVGSDTSNTDSIAILRVPTPPVFSGVFDILDGPEGSTINYDVSSLFSNSPTSYAFTGSYPTGLSIDNTGLITGTLQDGTWTGYAVTATNIDGSDISNTDSITVASLAPVFSGVFDILDGNVGDTVSYDVSGLFSNTPTSYSTNGAFPTGLSIDNAGLITGTLVEGTWNGYSVTATNSYGTATSNTDSINVVILTGPAFIASNSALTSVQGVDTAGDICNILPRGTTPAISLHDALILAPDYQGVYQSYAVDDPIWKGGRVDAGETYATDGVGGDLQPYAQCNEAATNVVWPSGGASPTTAPNGQLMQEVVSDADNAFNAYGIAYNISLTAGVAFTLSARVLYVDSRYASFLLSNFSTTEVYVYDLQNVVSIGKDGSGNFFGFKSYITAEGGNVFKLTLVVPASYGQDGGGAVYVKGGYKTTGSGRYLGDTFWYSDFMAYEGEFISPPIPTTTAAASIPKTAYTYPAANIPDPANAVIGITLDYAGETDANVFDIGGLLTLKYVASQLTLSDGTNSVAVAITAGKRVIEITLTATNMTLDVDGVTSTGPYTPVASGLITVEEDHWQLTSKIYAFSVILTTMLGDILVSDLGTILTTI